MKRLILSILFITSTMYATEPKILYEEDPTLLITNIEVVATTGAADDPVEKAGLASLMGELMLRGTKNRSRTKFQSEMERMGAALQVGTTPETIVFEGKVIKENTEAFIALLSDAILNPAFSDTEFKGLKREQLAEISHRKNNNGRLAGLTLRREAFKGTPLERSVEGGIETVSKIKLADIKQAYKDRFHQGNVIFGVSSAIPEAEMKKSLTAIWSKLPDGLKKAPRSITPNIPAKPTLVVINKPNTSTGSIIMAQPGITAQDEARYALAVSNFGFGGEPLVSRLFKVIRGELGWTYSIGSTYHAMGSLSTQQGLYVISSTPTIEFTVKTILKSMSMWSDYATDGLRGEELILAKESLVNSYPFDFESAEKRVSMKLYSHINGTPILSPEEYAKKINSFTLKDLQNTLKAKHPSSGWFISVVADAKVIEKQLAEEQKERPEAERLTISKIITPDQVIH